jgi:hypothetical protein
MDIPVVCMPIICHLFASDICLRTMLTIATFDQTDAIRNQSRTQTTPAAQ